MDWTGAADDARFAISFRVQKKIKHCVIKEEGRLFTVGINKFETLADLISHYSKYPFYQKVKLTQAVNQELVKTLGNSMDDDIYTHTDYLDTSAICSDDNNIRVRTLYDYEARRSDELSFRKNETITNVVKEHEGWWRGVLLKMDGLINESSQSGWVSHQHKHLVIIQLTISIIILRFL